MTKIYGKDQLDTPPDVVTYCHQHDGSFTTGYWKDDRLWQVTSHPSLEVADNLESYSAAKHVQLVETDQVIVLDSADYHDDKQEDYFSNVYSDDTRSMAVQVKDSGQTIVYKPTKTIGSSEATPQQRHGLEGIALLTSSKDMMVILICLDTQIILACCNKGVIQHYKILESNDAFSIGYHTLAFYQHNQISPLTPLVHSGLEEVQISGLSTYLPHLDSMEVPSSKLGVSTEDHTDLIPHYLAYSCVS